MGQIRPVGFTTIFPADSPKQLSLERVLDTPVPEHHFRCAAWHLSLSNLEQILYGQPEGVVAASELTDLEEQFGLHQLFVSQIGTNFKLSGPAGCDASFTGTSLRQAAKLLVASDAKNRRIVCDWFSAKNLPTSDDCHRPEALKIQEGFRLRGRVVMSNTFQSMAPN
jgi:hypothetical protein